MESIENIQAQLKETLSEKRYLHSIGTMKMAKILAKKYNVDENIAMLTGLAHDMGKEIPLEKQPQEFKVIEVNNDLDYETLDKEQNDAFNAGIKEYQALKRVRRNKNTPSFR